MRGGREGQPLGNLWGDRGTTSGQPPGNPRDNPRDNYGTSAGQLLLPFSIFSGWVTDSPGPAAVPLWGSCVAKLGVAPFSSLRHPDFCYSGEKG